MSLLEEILAKCSPELIEQRRLREIADVVSVGRTRTIQPRLIGEGTVSDVLGLPAGPVFVMSLRRAAEAALPDDAKPEQMAQKALIEQAWRLLSRANLDVGLASVQGGLRAMVGVLPGLTGGGAEALIALAKAPHPVSIEEVASAMEALK